MSDTVEDSVPLAQPTSWEGYGSEGDRILMCPMRGRDDTEREVCDAGFPATARRLETIEQLQKMAERLNSDLLQLELLRRQMADPTRFVFGEGVRVSLGDKVHRAGEKLQEARVLVSELSCELMKRANIHHKCLQEIAIKQKHCSVCGDELTATDNLHRLRCGHVAHFGCTRSSMDYVYRPPKTLCTQCGSPEPHTLDALCIASGATSADESASILLESDIELNRAYDGIPVPSDPIEEVEFSQRARKRRRRLVFE